MAISEKYASSAGAGAKDGSSEGNAWDWATMLSTAAAGDRVNFKGDHTLTGNASFTNTGSATAPIIVRGYSSTIGDLESLGRAASGALTTTGFPTFTTGSSVLTMPQHAVLQNVIVSGSRNGPILQGGNYGLVWRCSVNNANTGASTVAHSTGTTGMYAVDSDFILSGGSGGLAALNVQTSFAIGCRCDGGPATGIILASAGGGIVGCTAYSAATDAVRITATSNNVLIASCTLVGAGSDGVHQVASATRLACIINCLITDNAEYGLYAVDAAAPVLALHNRLDRNTSGASSGATDWLAATSGLNNTTSVTQANEYEAAGSDDYRLKSTSPSLSIGIPLYADIGALQKEPAASSGGASGGRKGPLGMWKIG